MKATDADVSDSSQASMRFRSGRIKLSNAFGNEKQALAIPVRVEYWSGKSWIPAGDDTCTTSSLVLPAHVSRSNFRSHQGASTTALSGVVTSALSLSGGSGFITLAAPGTNKTGSVDVELNLSGTGANLPWLQSLDAACGSTVCNPKARASFGVYTPESRKTVHIQNVQ